MFGDHACHPPFRPVVKPREGLLQPGGQEPCLETTQEPRLQHLQIEPTQCSIIQSLPYQDICQPPPFLPRLP